MTFKQTLTLATLSLSLFTGVAVAAGVPGNVKSVQATVTGNGMTVLWTPVPGAFTYRVYYSHESILQNGGNYDDFEQTADSQTMFVFSSAPLTSDTIYVGVLAVDKDGNEGEGFEVEASVKIPVASNSSSVASTVESSPSSASSISAMPVGENPTSTAVPMGIRSVQAVSATGVLVTFTKDVRPDANINGETFLITTLSGTVLLTTKTEVKGATVLLTTTVMSPNTEYILGILSPVAAIDGTNATSTEPQVHFKTSLQTASSVSSSEYGRNPNLPGSSASPTTAQVPVDPANLGLSAILRKDGMYDVLARWSPAQNAEAYSLYTSKNSSPYSWNSAVGQQETTVQYRGITPGTFGVKVATRTNNAESAGIEKVITLPASGIGILGIAAVAGAGAARRMQRRKKIV